MSNLVTVSTKISPETRAAIEAAAAALNISPAELVRRSCHEFLNRPDSVQARELATDLELLGRVKLLEKKLACWERGLRPT